jgi:hypothetical protein
MADSTDHLSVAHLLDQIVEYVSISHVVEQHNEKLNSLDAQIMAGWSRRQREEIRQERTTAPAPVFRESTPVRRRRSKGDGASGVGSPGAGTSGSEIARASTANSSTRRSAQNGDDSELWASVRQGIGVVARGKRAAASGAKPREQIVSAPLVLDAGGPNGGEPSETQFGRCCGDSVLNGDDSLTRLLQRRVAALSSLSYETMRAEKRERIERNRNAVTSGVAPQVLSGEQMAALMRHEMTRGAHQQPALQDVGIAANGANAATATGSRGAPVGARPSSGSSHTSCTSGLSQHDLSAPSSLGLAQSQTRIAQSRRFSSR